jgi:hypothetical protein
MPSRSPQKFGSAAVFSALAVAMVAGSANASVSDPALTIFADNGSATDVFTIPLALLAPGGPVGSLTYTLPGSVTLPNTGTIIQNLNLVYVPENAVPAQENRIGLNYTLWTGSEATTFTVSSGEFTLPGLPAQFGRGSAGVSITNGTFDGTADADVVFTGLQGGGLGFLTQFDGGFGAGPAYTPAGSLFNVFGPASFSSPNSDFGIDSLDYTFLGVPRTTMSSQWRFSLSPNDQVGVISSFFSSSVIPAPGAAALLAFGGLVVARRRR